LRIRRRASAAGFGFVDDVVVNQRSGVNDFDHSAEANGRAVFAVKEFRGQQQQRRTQPLAAASAQVLADFGDDLDAGNRVAPELTLDGGKIVAQQLKYFFRASSGRCRQVNPPLHAGESRKLQ
jgi:hypothetical protein